MSEGAMLDLIADWRVHMSAQHRALFYTDTTGIVFRCETLSPEPRVGVSDSGVLNGTRSPDGDKLPHGLSVRVSWDVQYLTKRYRGKTYFGALREQDQNAGEAEAAYFTLVTTWMNAKIARYGVNGTNTVFVFCILSDPDHVLPSGVAGVGQRTPQLAGVYSAQTYSTLTYLRRRER
jgi:hypothetical protein